jgi:hypothetical protein
MPARRIADLLSAGELHGLARQAQRLARLQRTLLDAVPPPLSKAIRVKNCRAGTLFLVAGNAAAAAKLRHLVPRLLLHLRQWDAEVNRIRIEVQVAMHKAEPRKSSGKTAIGEAALRHFERLEEVLQPSPLRAAIRRLVQRRKSSG